MRRPLRTAHARIWTVLALALPVLLIAALALRQGVPADRPAVFVGDDDAGQEGGQ